jgi:hypothetical protein
MAEAESPEPVQVVVSGDLVAELRVLHAAGLRALEAEAVQRLRLRPRLLPGPDAGPRLGRLRLRRRVLALPLPRRALAPGARHGRGRARHVPRAAPGVPARGAAAGLRRRRAEVARERAETGRVVGRLRVRRVQLLPLEARRGFEEVEQRRGARRVGGVPARDAGRPAPELARVHLHDPRAAVEPSVPAVGQPAAVHHRQRQRLRGRNNPLLRTKNDEKF